MIPDDSITELRRQFIDTVNISDKDSVYKWVLTYDYLSGPELATIAQVSIRTISKWRYRAHGNVPKPGKCTVVTARSTPTLIASPDWDTKQWLTSKYGVYKCGEIAAAVGCSASTILRRLKQYDIVKPIQTTHPCDNIRWLTKHYVNGLKTQDECARLAHVSKMVLVNWLIKYNIPVRSFTSSRLKRMNVQPRSSIWAKKLVHKLESLPDIKKLKVLERGFIIWYLDGVKEVYWIGQKHTKRRAYLLDRINSTIENIPKCYEQYPGELGEPTPYPAHLIITRTDWERATVMEQRIAIHRMIYRLKQQGYMQPTFPLSVIQADLDRIRATKLHRCVYKNSFETYIGMRYQESPWWSLALHFFDISPAISNAWSYSREMCFYFNRVARKRCDLSTKELIRALCSEVAGTRVLSPTSYIGMLSHMGVKGTVLDLYPNLGHKALACAVLGLKYMTRPNFIFEKAMKAGYADFIGLDWCVDDGSKVDLVIADDNFKEIDINVGFEYAERAKRLMCFVPAARRAEWQEQLHPETVISVLTRAYTCKPDYMFCF